jgi:hypothetical protein
MKKSPIKTKSYLLAIKIVELYKRLSEQRKERECEEVSKLLTAIIKSSSEKT